MVHQSNTPGRKWLFVLPWRGKSNERISLKDAIKSRKFSLAYLLVIWSIIGMLGFASTVNCEGTWQLRLQCEYSYWITYLVDKPFVFFRNLFTTPFLHNGMDHILFVSVLGILVIVQSHEALFGSKKTALIFFSSYFTVAPFFAFIYNPGIEIFPDSEFLQDVLGRSWIGGSIGMFQVFGSLATKSKKPILILAIPILFEVFNLTVLRIHPQISIMHIMSSFVGYGLSLWLFKKS